MESLIKRHSAVNCLERINNTTVSPFAYRPSERIVHCEYPEKSKYISQYSINETQKLVLKAVEEMLFCTSKLIMAKLDTMNINVEPKTVRNAIDNLFEGGYLHKIKFCTNETASNTSCYRVYFLSYRKGGSLFRAVFGRNAKRISYAESVTDPTVIKKYLAINQYLINISAAPLLERGQVINKKSFLSSFPVRILGSAQVNRNLVFFEAFRRSDTPEITLEKQSRFAKFLRSPFKNVTPAIEGESVALVAICEDAEHAEEMRKFLRKTYRGVNVTFTYDTAIFDSSDCVELELEQAS